MAPRSGPGGRERGGKSLFEKLSADEFSFGGMHEVFQKKIQVGREATGEGSSGKSERAAEASSPSYKGWPYMIHAFQLSVANLPHMLLLFVECSLLKPWAVF